MRFFRLAPLLFLPAFPVSATDVDVSAGVEYFLWEEYDSAGLQILDEAGPRSFVGVMGTNHLNRGWSIDFGGRVFSGSVNYDGETQEQALPVSTKTDYNGYALEIALTHYNGLRRNLDTGELLLRFAYGHESWRRSLRDTSANNDGIIEPVRGYVERYYVNYLKLGLQYQREGSWTFSGGAKAPIWTTERISGLLSSGDTITLYPEGQLSLFAGAEFLVLPRLSIEVNYDSFRFAESDPSQGYVQPQSTQDTLGMAIHYHF